jgi:hypothetical protein
MILNKITIGYVIQSYDTDKRKFVSQEFIASDDTAYETADGDEINQKDFEDRADDATLLIELKQPE